MIPTERLDTRTAPDTQPGRALRRSERGPRWLWRAAEGGIAGAAEVLAPANALGAPDWREAELLERTLAFIELLPRAQGRLYLILFATVELGAPLLVPALARFSRLPLERRTRAWERWRRSRLYPVRLIGDGLKMSLTMLYLSHPAVARHIGEFKTCERPLDPYPMPIRTHSLDARTPSPLAPLPEGEGTERQEISGFRNGTDTSEGGAR